MLKASAKLIPVYETMPKALRGTFNFNVAVCRDQIFGCTALVSDINFKALFHVNKMKTKQTSKSDEKPTLQEN